MPAAESGGPLAGQVVAPLRDSPSPADVGIGLARRSSPLGVRAAAPRQLCQATRELPPLVQLIRKQPTAKSILEALLERSTSLKALVRDLDGVARDGT